MRFVGWLVCAWGVMVFAGNAATAQADFDSLNKQGQFLYQAGDMGKSMAAFEDAIKAAKPGSQDELTASKNLLLPLGQLNDKDKLWQAKRKVVLLDHQLNNTPIPEEFVEGPGGAQGAKSALDEVNKLMQARNYAGAQSKLQELLKANKDDGNAHFYMGGCLYGLKKYKAALAEYDWVAKNAPTTGLQSKGKVEAQKLRMAMAGICPGNCLKPSTPGWKPGDHGLNWITFRYRTSSESGWKVWSEKHMGEVIEFPGGIPTNMGKCKICNGTGRIKPLK